MSVLITGAAGFVGRAVVERLQQLGVSYVAVQGRWSSRSHLEAELEGADIDSCVHLGWYAAPRDYATSVPGNLDALQRSLELVDLLTEMGCRRLLGVGSAAEYAPTSEVLTEESVLGAQSIYGAAKAALRLVLRALPEGTSVAWARPFNMTGPGESPERLLPFVANQLALGLEVDLSPGEQVRDFLDVRDVASALVAVLQSDLVGDVNVCSGDGRTLRDLLMMVAGERAELLRFGARDYLPDEAMRVVGDPSRLTRLGWKPEVPLERTLAELVKLRS